MAAGKIYKIDVEQKPSAQELKLTLNVLLDLYVRQIDIGLTRSEFLEEINHLIEEINNLQCAIDI